MGGSSATRTRILSIMINICIYLKVGCLKSYENWPRVGQPENLMWTTQMEYFVRRQTITLIIGPLVLVVMSNRNLPLPRRTANFWKSWNSKFFKTNFYLLCKWYDLHCQSIFFTFHSKRNDRISFLNFSLATSVPGVVDGFLLQTVLYNAVLIGLSTRAIWKVRSIALKAAPSFSIYSRCKTVTSW